MLYYIAVNIRFTIVLTALSFIFTGCGDALGDLLEESRLGDVGAVSAAIQEDEISGVKFIKVSWEAAKNTYGYYVFRYKDTDEEYDQQFTITWTAVKNPDTGEDEDPTLPTFYDDNSLSGDPANYYYRVQAYSRAGSSTNNTSKLSDPSDPVAWSGL
ncbi:hypothetical protein FACS189496_4180 [Bacilli bacterium]|nr:hypothetical protein FACS189496_4180 [Bacilli bacterium]